MNRHVAVSKTQIDSSELNAIGEELIERFPYESISRRVERLLDSAELCELYPQNNEYEEKFADIALNLVRLLDSEGEADLADRLRAFVGEGC